MTKCHLAYKKHIKGPLNDFEKMQKMSFFNLQKHAFFTFKKKRYQVFNFGMRKLKIGLI